MRNAIIAPQFQSTLPQGERQEEYYNAVQEQMISIHAPARGATCNRDWTGGSTKISIHAPARGATFRTIRCFFENGLFQSTLPQGERLLIRLFSALYAYFNPRSRKGSDAYCLLGLLVRPQFQSTLPQGERPLADCYSLGSCPNFNPRSRKGSDYGQGQ